MRTRLVNHLLTSPLALKLGDPRCSVAAMPRLEQAQWWTIRRAQNRKPATYRCPLCGYQLHAMSEHVLIAPEGDTERRRHAHTECVRAACEAGRLPSYDEWRRNQPKPPSLFSRMRRRGR